jgi:alkylation response protein AidB-like acyl-CoA dehydrogenase
MDLSLTEEQEMLWKSARDFLTSKVPKTLVREMEEDEKGYVPELWKEMADLGWIGLPFPEAYGGGGFTFLDLVILLEEMGRACLPGPFMSTVILGGMPVAEFGTEEQKKAILPKLCQGQLIMTMALTEPIGRYEAKAVRVGAKAEGDGYVISGTKLFVNDANVADKVIVAARTSDKGSPEEGITLFIVDRESAGVSVQVLKTMAGDKQCEFTMDKVKVSKADVLGEVDKGWEIVKKVIEWAALAKAAEMQGGAQQVLEMTIQYGKDRVQFDRPIGSFQAIQHYMADMSIDVDSARVSLHKAAWMLSEGIPCRREISVIKGWLSEAYRRVTAQSHQIHAAIGFTKDHDLELYFRRAKAAELYFGDADFHREIVAQELGM